MNLALIGSVAGNTLLTSLSSKLIDTVIQNRHSSTKDKKQWVRNTKLELFSKISQEILSCNEHNLHQKKTPIQQHLSKVILLIEEQSIKNTIKNYLFILDEYENAKDMVNIHEINTELIETLSHNIHK